MSHITEPDEKEGEIPKNGIGRSSLLTPYPERGKGLPLAVDEEVRCSSSEVFRQERKSLSFGACEIVKGPDDCRPGYRFI